MAHSEYNAKKTDFDPERQHQIQEKRQQRRKQAAERKKFKRNQQPKGPRRKDWSPADMEPSAQSEWEGDSYDGFERIMPRDEGDRRRSLEQAAFARNRADVADSVRLLAIPQDADNELQPGKVVAIASALCRVAIGEQNLLCNVRGTIHAQENGFTNALAVGDQVLVRVESKESGVVERVLPRRSLLTRTDNFHTHLQQIVVANADQLLIVASWRDPIIWFELIDRYLVAAARNQLPAIICVNKIDLAGGPADYERDLQPYHDLGIPCVFTSAQNGAGIDELRALLDKRTSVLAGLSGVGKSSLLAAVQPGLTLRVGVVSDHSGEGRHTTTQAVALRLDEQTWVVDTPGIREFGLSGLRRADLANFFPEMAVAAPACRFRNCTHHDEPGCAVRARRESGEIASSRFHSYRQIYASLPA